MDGQPIAARSGRPPAPRRWVAHSGHDAPGPHLALRRAGGGARRISAVADGRWVTLDGARGEGGGQILRTALTLSLLTGRPFRITQIRANRDRPGLRPQHLKAVEAAAALGHASVSGAAVGSRELTFRPAPYESRDLRHDIGTAGSTALVLHTLHLPLALRADRPVRLSLTGGTFNAQAPSYPFLESSWGPALAALGLPIALAMPAAGFYPRGGGRLDAWIEPAAPRPVSWIDRGPLVRIRGQAGIANLRSRDIAARMRRRAEELLAERGLEAAIETVEWPSPGQGAALSLVAEHAPVASTFVGLGQRGKRAEAVAEEAVAELLAYEDAAGAVDPHSADQILLPLALAEGPSRYTVSAVTEHLRTNAETIRAFLNRSIRIDEPSDGPPCVSVDG
jgi:RNA 3'-terminal phosphate cyclase (ATP)